MFDIENIIKNSSVLIVDDEKNICSVLKIYLNGQKTKEVFTASSYDEAAAFLKSKDIDLVVSDIRLNGKSGIDLLRHIKKQQLPCEIILMTAYSDIESAVKALNYGAYAYVTKPFNDLDREFFTVVEAALKHHKFKEINSDLLAKLKNYYKNTEDKLNVIKEFKVKSDKKYPCVFQKISFDYVNRENLSYHFNFYSDTKKINFYFLAGKSDFSSAVKTFYSAGYFDAFLESDNFVEKKISATTEGVRCSYDFKTGKLAFSGKTSLNFFHYNSIKKELNTLDLDKPSAVSFNAGDALITLHSSVKENLTPVIREQIINTGGDLSLNLQKIIRQYTKDYAFTVIAKK